jgi:hypothetical protein
VMAYRNVTAIFAILTRLRQAVLHPSLILKRLKENLLAQGVKRRDPSSDELGADGELDERDIQTMIERYTAGKGLGLVKGGVAAVLKARDEKEKEKEGEEKGQGKEVATAEEGEADWMEVRKDEEHGEGEDCPICLEVRFRLSCCLHIFFKGRTTLIRDVFFTYSHSRSPSGSPAATTPPAKAAL